MDMDTPACETIRELSEPSALPDGSPVRVLSLRSVRSAAHLCGLSLRQIEIQALRAAIIPERYLRNFKTLSHEDQARLLETRVTLIGLGGLGGPIIEGLARLGFGVIKAADHDLFEPSNLNRQTLSDEDALDSPKARVAMARVGRINPAAELTVLQEYIEPGGFADYFSGADIAIDALGGMTCRPAAEEGAASAGTPLISASVAGATAIVATTLPGGRGFASLFCPGGTVSGSSAEDTLGCLVPAIQVASGLVLAEAVRLALGRPPLFGGPYGQMAVVDLDTMSLERFTLA